ncbi:MAG: hypothetical protein AB1671_27785 [Thermodesulfobacteriota bacterium]
MAAALAGDAAYAPFALAGDDGGMEVLDAQGFDPAEPEPDDVDDGEGE